MPNSHILINNHIYFMRLLVAVLKVCLAGSLSKLGQQPYPELLITGLFQVQISSNLNCSCMKMNNSTYLPGFLWKFLSANLYLLCIFWIKKITLKSSAQKFELKGSLVGPQNYVRHPHPPFITVDRNFFKWPPPSIQDGLHFCR